ncbi:MAG: diacylglycerol kinase family lipid kinase, partial [Mesorhizobium sp.]
MKVGVVLNPIAGGGWLKRHWPEVSASLRKHFGDFELRETQATGDAERLALVLAASGFDLVIAAGGDGTASEVADGLLQAASRHFINIASLGLSGATDRAVNADKRKGNVSAKALFYWRTVWEFMRYRFQDVVITVDDGVPVEARVALVAVANGKFFGAGLMIAPDAELDDGQFDIVVLRAAGKLK